MVGAFVCHAFTGYQIGGSFAASRARGGVLEARAAEELAAVLQTHRQAPEAGKEPGMRASGNSNTTAYNDNRNKNNLEQ